MPPVLPLILAATLPGPPSPLPASFTPLGDLPGGAFQSVASAVSADGSTVVGSSNAATGSIAFRWTKDTGMTPLGDLPGGATKSIATGVSADGSVVVGYSASSASGSGDEAFRWIQGQMLALGSLTGGQFRSQATGVSDDGLTVVGWSSSADGPTQAFRWRSATGMIPLGFLAGGTTFSQANAVSANGALIVGRASTPTGFAPFQRTVLDGMLALAQPLNSEGEAQALDVTPDARFIVGSVNTFSTDGPAAFRWNDRFTPVPLGDLPGGLTRSVANAINADGSVIVGSSDATNGTEAFIWTPQRGMESLRHVLQSEGGLDLSGWTLDTATDVSDDGLVIVGRGRNPQGATEAWVARLGAPLPPLPPCDADWNRDGMFNDTDFFVFIRDYFAGIADYNDDGFTNPTDWFEFTNAFFRPGPGCV